MENKNIIILSPHPDDECLNGLIPLKFKACTYNYKVTNIAMTLGSDSTQRKRRQNELKQACEVLGFENYIAGFTSDTVQLINKLSPSIIILPHAKDKHPTHQKVHDFFINNLHKLNFDSWVFFNEYWFPIENPNIMLEMSAKEYEVLLKALKCHKGEMARANYHLNFESWLIDNTRRGQEYFGGFGSNQKNIKYSNMFKLKKLKNNTLHNIKQTSFIESNHNLLEAIESFTIVE